MVILRRGVQAPFASFAGGREDGERPHQPEGGRAGRLRGPVQNQETYPAEQADEGLLREAGALRAGAAAGACTWLCACERVHICMHTCAWMCAHVCAYVCMCVSAHARASLRGPSLLPSSPGCAHRLSQQTHCPPFPRTWGAVASGLGSGWTPPPLEVAEAEPVCSSSSSPRWLGHVCGDAALVTVWFPDSARSRPSVPQSSLAAHTVTSQTASF